MAQSFDSLTAAQIAAGVAAGDYTATEVAQASLAAAEEVYHLSVFSNIGEEITCLGIEDSRAYGYLNDAVFAVLARRASFPSALSVGGEYVSLISQMQQCPEVAVAFEYDMTAATAVSAVGAALGHIFGAMEVAAAGTALA